MYDSADELLREIAAGEDSRLDLKEVVAQGGLLGFSGEGGRTADETAKDLCAFANAEGGVLVYGVRDDGTVVGTEPEIADRLEQLVVNVAGQNVEPPLQHLLVIERVRLPDAAGLPRLCLKVEVKRAQDGVHAPKGRRPFLRVGSHCLEMTVEQMARLMERRDVVQPFEERALYRASLDDLDLAAFERFVAERRGEPRERAAAHVHRYLVNLKMARPDESGALRPTVLGALLFAKNLRAHLDGAFVKIVAYGGDVMDSDRQLDRKVVEGPVPDQIEATMAYLRTSPLLAVAATKTDQGRLDVPAYSLRALHEAVVNALAHRDYSVTGANVRVLIFTDRIEIASPGRLVNSLTVDDLFAGAMPRRRNEALVGALLRHRSPTTGRALMEGDGEGFLTMVRESEAVSGSKPVVKVVGDSVHVTFFARRGPPAA
jgi:ATP-dependent DNA helicase RecG